MILVCGLFFFYSTTFKPDFIAYNKEECVSYQLIASQFQTHPSWLACDTETFLPCQLAQY